MNTIHMICDTKKAIFTFMVVMLSVMICSPPFPRASVECSYLGCCEERYKKRDSGRPGYLSPEVGV